MPLVTYRWSFESFALCNPLTKFGFLSILKWKSCEMAAILRFSLMVTILTIIIHILGLNFVTAPRTQRPRRRFPEGKYGGEELESLLNGPPTPTVQRPRPRPGVATAPELSTRTGTQTRPKAQPGTNARIFEWVNFGSFVICDGSQPSRYIQLTETPAI